MVRGSFYKNISKSELKTRITEIAKLIEIEDFIDKKYGALSGGQKRCCDVARGLLNNPKALILDEPTTGLDPASRKNIWEVIRHIQETKNMTVFLTTHYMEEASSSDYIYIIDQGEIKIKGTPKELKDYHCFDYLYLYPQNKDQVISYLDTIDILNNLKQDISSFEVIKAHLMMYLLT